MVTVSAGPMQPDNGVGVASCAIACRVTVGSPSAIAAAPHAEAPRTCRWLNRSAPPLKTWCPRRCSFHSSIGRAATRDSTTRRRPGAAHRRWSYFGGTGRPELPLSSPRTRRSSSR